MFDRDRNAEALIDDHATGPTLDPLAEHTEQATPCILIADDHAQLRQALHDVLAVNFPGCDIVQASTAEEAVQLAKLHAPDVVVMDLHIPEMNGIAATRLIKQAHPATAVVMLTQHEDEAYQVQAAAAGVSSYIYKREVNQRFVPQMTELLPRLCKR